MSLLKPSVIIIILVSTGLCSLAQEKTSIESGYQINGQVKPEKTNDNFNKVENADITTINKDSIRHAPLMRRNSLFLELGGNAFFYSLNYERKVMDPNNRYNFLSLKLGVGSILVINTFSTTVSYVMGTDGKNFFEIGGGAGATLSNIFVANNRDYDNVYFTPIIGYRRELKSGFQMRSFITTVAFKQNNKVTNYLSLGLSFGYTF